MPKRIKSMQSAPPKETESVQNAPLKGTESIQSAFPYNNNKSQQFLYSEEILTKSLKEEWEEFNR